MCMSKLSIIIPIYNAALYLHRCIDSILSQSFTDYELLLIDDGSTDESGTICDEYATKDNRIRVFHKVNGGVSSARNLGLDNAIGEWVYFVDADDEVMPNGIKKLYSFVSPLVDLILAGYQICSELGQNKFQDPPKLNTKYNASEAIQHIYFDSYYGYMGYLWCKLFRRHVIEEQHLRFNEKIFYNEDRLFIVQFICALDNDIQSTNEQVYIYHQQANGAMNKLSKKFDTRFFTDLDATYLMSDSISCGDKFSKEIKTMAQDDIVASYRRIRAKMRETHLCSLHVLRLLNQKIDFNIYCRYVVFEVSHFFFRCKNKLIRTIKI